ncbi:hypothetical protein CVT24_013230 [Panaeolus cyanescens]|uniref:Uncharacterized protein n=1 Tax=Panaeolus cyanescens TaxID=181874 RepID=A0A409X295_9AGAR|nr:hypothetical protein CVT24_013230 [Panaeolus cyanescens]
MDDMLNSFVGHPNPSPTLYHSTGSPNSDHNPFVRHPDGSETQQSSPRTPSSYGSNFAPRFTALFQKEAILQVCNARKDEQLKELTDDLQLFQTPSHGHSAAVDLAKKYIQQRDNALSEVVRLTEELGAAKKIVASFESNLGFPPPPASYSVPRSSHWDSFCAIQSLLLSGFLSLCVTIWNFVGRNGRVVDRKCDELSDRHMQLEERLDHLADDLLESLGSDVVNLQCQWRDLETTCFERQSRIEIQLLAIQRQLEALDPSFS